MDGWVGNGKQWPDRPVRGNPELRKRLDAGRGLATLYGMNAHLSSIWRAGRGCFWLLLAALLAAQAAPAQEIGKPLPMPELGATLPYESGFVNLRIVDRTFRLYFLDKDKKLVAPLWTSARIKWEDVRNKLTVYGTTGMTPGGGPCLSAQRMIYPPYRFWVNLAFMNPPESATPIKYEFPRTLFYQPAGAAQ